MSSYIRSVYPGLQEVLEWCEDREQSISSEELSKAFGDEADALDHVFNLAEKSSELASALHGHAERTRRDRDQLRNKWVRSVEMTHASLRPRYGITKTNHAEDCDQSTKAEVRISASTSNRRMDGCGQNLREETRCSRKQDEHPRRDQDSGIGSNAATPDLESHVQMNQARFITFDELLEEIMRYLEHKTGKSLKMASAASTLANQSSHLLCTKEDRKAVEASFSELVAAECWAKQGQKGHAPSYSKGTYGKGPGNTNTNSGKAGKGSKGGSKGSRGKNASKGKKGKCSGKKCKGKEPTMWKKAKQPKRPMATRG